MDPRNPTMEQVRCWRGICIENLDMEESELARIRSRATRHIENPFIELCQNAVRRRALFRSDSDGRLGSRDGLRCELERARFGRQKIRRHG